MVFRYIFEMFHFFVAILRLTDFYLGVNSQTMKRIQRLLALPLTPSPLVYYQIVMNISISNTTRMNFIARLFKIFTNLRLIKLQ